MKRRSFVKLIAATSICSMHRYPLFGMGSRTANLAGKESDFCRNLRPLGRILQSPEYYVWGCSPIYDDEGNIHVFFSRWKAAAGWQAWISKCEIAHAVASKPEGPYEVVDVAVEPSGPGKWDAFTCHNPTIHKIGNRYALFFVGTRDGTVRTKSIGVAYSDSLYGPWHKKPIPLLEKGHSGDWDDFFVSNPALFQHPNGEFWLYYKGVSEHDWDAGRGIRRYGLAVAKRAEGPYKRVQQNPLVDFSSRSPGAELEDGYVFIEDNRIKMICRDNGYFNEQVGLYLESEDGIRWSDPLIAYHGAEVYGLKIEEINGLRRLNRFERPQLLMRDGRAAYLFAGIQGGQYRLSTGFVFEISQNQSR